MQPSVEVRDISKTYQLWRTPASRLWVPGAQRLERSLQRLGKLGRVASDRVASTHARSLDQVHALKPMNLTVQPGEAVGILGRNGSGKSTLLQIIAGTLPPTSGSVSVRGRVAVILQLGAGFHPQFSGRENVYMNAAVMGINRREVRRRIDEVIEFADIDEFIDRPLKAYSSGMRMRLAFAVQVMLSPDVLIIDEALSVGDLFFQQKCAEHLRAQIDKGTSVLFVSHSMGTVQQFCDRAIVLDQGNCIYEGTAEHAIARYSQMGSATASAIKAAINLDNIETPAQPNQSKNSATPTRWPKNDAFINMKPFVGTKQCIDAGRVRLDRLAVCDQDGNPRKIFEQGSTVLLACEYSVDGDLHRPSCGFSLRDKNSIKAHGMHMFQRPDSNGNSGPESVHPGQKLRIVHEIELGLANGMYSIDIGVCSAPPESWDGDRIPWERIEEHLIREIEVFDCLQLEVISRSTYTGYPLTHFGIANLPGSTTWEVVQNHDLNLNPDDASKSETLGVQA